MHPNTSLTRFDLIVGTMLKDVLRPLHSITFTPTRLYLAQVALVAVSMKYAYVCVGIVHMQPVNNDYATDRSNIRHSVTILLP